MSGDALVERGVLKGHDGWVTSLATSEADPSILVSGSRDRSVIVWRLTPGEDSSYGIAERRLTGHRHFVSDVTLASDGMHALSASWDGSLRLWDLATGDTTRQFHGHKKDVLSVALSADNRQILSGSRDRSVKLWNTIGECRKTIDGAHADWVSCVRFSVGADGPVIFSAGWDNVVRVFDTKEFKLRNELRGHTGYINTLTVSPDGSLCASGGKDGNAMLWDLNENKCIWSFNTHSTIYALAFSPSRYWLVTATAKGVTVYDLETKKAVVELVPDFGERGRKALTPHCTSLAWSADGSTLFAGYTDKTIRVYSVRV